MVPGGQRSDRAAAGLDSVLQPHVTLSAPHPVNRCQAADKLVPRAAGEAIPQTENRVSEEVEVFKPKWYWALAAVILGIAIAWSGVELGIDTSRVPKVLGLVLLVLIAKAIWKRLLPAARKAG